MIIFFIESSWKKYSTRIEKYDLNFGEEEIEKKISTSKTVYKQCPKCYEFFPSKPLTLEKYCPECRGKPYWCRKDITYREHFIEKIKKQRYVPVDVYDLYDLERPLKRKRNGKEEIVNGMFERVCRFCGAPLKKKDGTYSFRKRYCNDPNHDGYTLWAMSNWNTSRDSYIENVQETQKANIKKKLEEMGIDTKYYERLILCEKCGTLCKSHDYWFNPSSLKEIEIINVHHKLPVHTLTEENIMLLFAHENLICLCEKCHYKQDHHLKTVKRSPILHDKNQSKIEDFF